MTTARHRRTCNKSDECAPPAVVEDAFLDVNPDLTRQAVTVTCEEGRIDEVRICLTRDLTPRACGADVARDCALPSALLDPVR